MRVLITGAGGFFGMALTRAFTLGGDAVTALDREPSDDFELRPDVPRELVSTVSCNVADRASVLRLSDPNIEAVVHAAALTPTPEQERADPERILDVNLGGTINLLSLARRLPQCKRFLLISSSAVYAAREAALLREGDADGGTSFYGAAKLAGEGILFRYAATYGLSVAAVRPSSLYGPGERSRESRPYVTPIWRLVDAARRGMPVRVVHEEARNDWLHVDDAAAAVRLLVRAEGVEGAFTLSLADPRPFREVVKTVSGLLPLRVDPSSGIEVDGGVDRPGVMSNEGIREAVDWTPRSLSLGIQAYVEALQRTATDLGKSGG